MKFAKNFAPQISKPIMLPESFNYSFALSDVTLDDSAAAKNVSYIGGHLYGSQPKTYTKAINLGKHVWMTEWMDHFHVLQMGPPRVLSRGRDL